MQDCSLYARVGLDDCGAGYHENARMEGWQPEDGRAEGWQPEDDRVEGWQPEDMEAEKSSSESREDSGEDSSESGSLPGKGQTLMFPVTVCTRSLVQFP